jgi:hypothetical protein
MSTDLFACVRNIINGYKSNHLFRRYYRDVELCRLVTAFVNRRSPSSCKRAFTGHDIGRNNLSATGTQPLGKTRFTRKSSTRTTVDVEFIYGQDTLQEINYIIQLIIGPCNNVLEREGVT